jgi:MOSC domain-containing protein YiiM
MPELLSIQVGMPVNGSAYRKHPVEGPVDVGWELIAGDDQGSKQFHGGPDRVVLAYAAAHYPRWEAEYGQPVPFGAFGENFTVEGLDERTVCVGDRHRFGDVVLEVSCPRSPCMKIEQNLGIKGIFLRVRETGRIGWLYRTIQPGLVAPGEFEVLPGGYPSWDVGRVMDVFNRVRAGERPAEAEELMRCEPLVATWRELLQEKLQGSPR